MSKAPIRVLKPNVSQVEAVRAFAAPGLGALYRRIRIGRLQRIADVYVPFSLYRVRYKVGGSAKVRTFAIDTVNGSLDLFEFPSVPAEGDFLSMDTRNCIKAVLPEVEAGRLLRQKILRVIFQEGLFKLHQLKLEISYERMDLHIPYWLAFYGQHVVHCRVMDAVRRRVEGAKASAFFEEWLAG
jgi:hypothetical protein